jgi:hypothetical protein
LFTLEKNYSPSKDLTLDCSFASVVDSTNSMVVKQSSDDFLRFDYHHETATLNKTLHYATNGRKKKSKTNDRIVQTVQLLMFLTFRHKSGTAVGIIEFEKIAPLARIIVNPRK